MSHNHRQVDEQTRRDIETIHRLDDEQRGYDRAKARIERLEKALREIVTACSWDGEGQAPLCPAELIAREALEEKP